MRAVKPSRGLRGEIILPGDKSISHRSLIFGAMAEGETTVRNFLPSHDTLATERCLKALGVEIDAPGEASRVVRGGGWRSFREPGDVLDALNSGTTMRLMLGLLAGFPFFSVITGDDSLKRRPMGRVADPLTRMGASIMGRAGGTLAPLAVRGGGLKAIHYRMPVASAQVKSAVMLAALQAEGETAIEEPLPTRDHTERFFHYMGYPIEKNNGVIKIEPGGAFAAKEIFVPSDFSSAAFFLVAGLCAGDSDIRIRNVGLNPTRTAFLDVLKRMGGAIEVEPEPDRSHEPAGTLRVKSSALTGTDIAPEEVPNLIDELPVFAVAAACANGRSSVRGARELRVKESDRIGSLRAELEKMGVAMEEHPDGFTIQGPCKLKGSAVNAHGDHRLAMALAIAALMAEGETAIEGAESVDISFPGFFQTLANLAS